MNVSTSALKGIVTTLAVVLVILWSGIHFLSKPRKRLSPAGNLLSSLAFEPGRNSTFSSEPLVFPRDHGIHWRSGSEFWQIGGVLETSNRERFGFESTWIRVDLDTDLKQRRSAWATDQIFHLSHGVIPFKQGETIREAETGRKALGLAGYDPQQHKIWVYERQLLFHESGAGSDIQMNIPDGAYPVHLEFHAAKPMIVAPLSRPLRYYTFTRMNAKGTLSIDGEHRAVSGQAYFEHSWGKLPQGRGQLVQNRWILQLSNGIDLNLLESRRRDGSGKAIHSGFMVLPGGESIAFEPGDPDIEQTRYWTSSTSAIRYPVQWKIRIPEADLMLDVRAWRDDQETPDSPINWAGMASVSGQQGTHAVTGFGQVQLSGY
ncbi:MAG: lipocalin family protein [Methylococcales bacterium]